MAGKKPIKDATWIELLTVTRTASEKEAENLLKREIAGPCRENYIRRIYGRFSKLRRERELTEYLNGATKAA